MSKSKKNRSRLNVTLQGVLLSFAIYMLGLVAIAALGTNGMLLETNFVQTVYLLAFLASLAGAFLCVRRISGKYAVTTLLACIATFMLLLISIALVFWNGVHWAGQGGVTLLFAFAGGITAMFLRKKKPGRRKQLR